MFPPRVGKDEHQPIQVMKSYKHHQDKGISPCHLQTTQRCLQIQQEPFGGDSQQAGGEEVTPTFS